MQTHFARVLADESVSLAAVTDASKLAEWRHRVVKEVMTPRSPYAMALRQPGDVRERAEFLARWRDLIADAIGRVLRSHEPAPSNGSLGRGDEAVDSQKNAVLILAALHGGCTLSHVAQDQWPLNAALDIALAPFADSDESFSSDTDTVQPGQ
jgi:hypothetical protein